MLQPTSTSKRVTAAGTQVAWKRTALQSVVQQAAAEVRRHWSHQAAAGIVLGTGLGNLSRHVDVQAELDYCDLPGFPVSTALAHRGRLLCGQLAGIPVLTMDGRCHLYEGCTYDEVTLPIRVMHALGISLLIVSNASGGLNPQLRSGMIVVVDDHINFMGNRGLPESQPAVPLRPARPARPLYDPQLIDQALAIARREDFTAVRGVYVGVSGPNYETRAEYRFFRRIGGDVVGMSTIPEVDVAARSGMRVLVLSTVTNVACPDLPHWVDPQHVVEAASCAEPHVRKIVLDVLQSSEKLLAERLMAER